MKRLMLVALVSILVAACSKSEAPVATTTTETVQSSTQVSSTQATATVAEAAIPTDGAVLWLVADDAAGGAANGKVASWASGNGLVVSAKADAPDAQPAVVPNIMNGHAVVRFSGDRNMLKTDVDLSPARMANATVVAVFNSSTAEPSPLRKLYGDDDGGYDRAAGLDNRSGDGKNYTVFTGLGVKGYFTLEAGKTYITVDQYSAKEFSGWVNGASAISKAEAGWGTALPNLYIGGTGTAYQEFWNGDLAELIVYARPLTDEERTHLEDHLAKKYGVTLTRTAGAAGAAVVPTTAAP